MAAFMIEPADTESLKAAIEEMHGGKARLVQSVPTEVRRQNGLGGGGPRL